MKVVDHIFRNFWEGFNKSRLPGFDDRIEDYIATSNSFAQRRPFTSVFTNVDGISWTPPGNGTLMMFAKKIGQPDTFELFNAVKGQSILFSHHSRSPSPASLGNDFSSLLKMDNAWGGFGSGFHTTGGSVKKVLCFSQSMRGTEFEEITKTLVPDKKQRTRMQLATIVRAKGTQFVTFSGEAANLYELLSKVLLSNDDAADIRLHYTNSIITDWSVKANRLISLSIKRGIQFESFSNDVWDEVVKTLLAELSHVEVVSNLFLVLDDLDTKLEEQRHNDMDHCLARMNLAKNQSFKFSKPANESMFDSAGVLAIAASVTGMAGVSGILGPAAAVVSNGLWLASTIAAAMEEEEGTFEQEYRDEDFTFLDIEHLVDKSMKDAKKNQRIQIEILSCPRKLKVIAGLVTDDFRFDVGQTAILAENTKVSNRLRFYQMLMPAKFCIRRIPPGYLFVIRGLNVGYIEKNGLNAFDGSQIWLSLKNATPTYGTVTDGNLIKELGAEQNVDTAGLGVSREDFFYRRGFWNNLKVKDVKDIMS